MILALVLGLLVGFGAFTAWRALAPPAPPLAAALARLNRPANQAGITQTAEVSGITGVLGRRLGGPIESLSGALGLQKDRLMSDLNLVGRAPEEHFGQKALLALLGLALPAITTTVMSVGGVSVPFTVPVVVGLGLAVVFFFVPDLLLRSEADDRRRDFRHSLGSFLDLVVISLAGGAGVDSALRDAASIGQGWSFTQLRNALDVTALTGETPWAALTRLGMELGVDDLPELAASVSLAGTEGARVRDSLSAKAGSLRDHALAQAEAEAQATTERMALPVVLLFVGFLLLIGYPAVDAVLTGV
jgi:tight adherence protein C